MKINVKEVGVGIPVLEYAINKIIPTLPALDTKGNKLPVGEYEVELEYQGLYGTLWLKITENAYKWFNENETGYQFSKVREVYIASIDLTLIEMLEDSIEETVKYLDTIKSKPEKENMMLKPVTSKLIEREALARAKNIVFGPGNNNYGRDKPIESVVPEKEEPAIEAVSNSKSAKGDIIAELLGIDKQELNLHDLCNYHINLSDCFSAMDRWHEQHTAALSVTKQPENSDTYFVNMVLEKDVDTIEQAAESYAYDKAKVSNTAYWDGLYYGFIAGAEHIESAIENRIAELEECLTERDYKTVSIINELRSLIKPHNP